MENFGERLKRLREENTGLSQRKLAAEIGVTGATISNWEDLDAGDTVRSEHINKLAKRLKVNSEHLLTGILNTEADPMDDEDVEIPVIDVHLQGGTGAHENPYADNIGDLTFKKHWIRKKGLRADDLRIVVVEGDSMAPFLMQGDKVVVDTSKGKIIDGKVFALAYGDDLRIKRLFKQADGSLRIVSENQVYKDEVISGDEIERLNIIGQAVHRMGDRGF